MVFDSWLATGLRVYCWLLRKLNFVGRFVTVAVAELGRELLGPLIKMVFYG